MNDILNFLDHTIELEEKFLPKFPAGTTQHSLTDFFFTFKIKTAQYSL